MKAGCKGEISYLSEFQSELYERNPHAACIDALSTHRPTIESPFNVDCIGVYGRSLLTLHSIETRCSAPAARRGTSSRAQFPLASTYSPPARPLSRPVARSPMAHSPVRPGAASATHSPIRLQACPLAALPDLSPSRPLADGPLNRPSAPGPLGPLTRPLACRPTRSAARSSSRPSPPVPLSLPHRQYRCHSLFPRALPPRRSVGLATPASDHPVVAAAQT